MEPGKRTADQAAGSSNDLPRKKRSKNPFDLCLYVHTQEGSDSNPGTKEQPFKTFERAKEYVDSAGTCPGIHVSPKEARQAMAVFPCKNIDCRFCKFVNAKKRCKNCGELISSATREHSACGWKMNSRERADRIAQHVKPSTKKTLNPSQTLMSIARMLNALSDQMDAKWVMALSIPAAARNKGHLFKAMASTNNGLMQVDQSNNIVFSHDAMTHIGERFIQQSEQDASMHLSNGLINFMHVELGKKKFQQRLRREAPQQQSMHPAASRLVGDEAFAHAILGDPHGIYARSIRAHQAPQQQQPQQHHGPGHDQQVMMMFPPTSVMPHAMMMDQQHPVSSAAMSMTRGAADLQALQKLNSSAHNELPPPAAAQSHHPHN